MDHQIPHRHRREVVPLEFRPALPGVDGDEEAQLGPDVEEVLADQVLLDDVGISAHALLRTDDARPALAQVGRAIDPGRHVAERVAVEDGVRGARVVPARLHPAHPGARR